MKSKQDLFPESGNIAVVGQCGVGKTRNYVFPYIIQCAKKGESMIIADPKREIFENTSKYLEGKGYKIRIFNPANQRFSDSWDVLDGLWDMLPKRCYENLYETDIMAGIMCDIILNSMSIQRNSDSLWDRVEWSLLKALSLFVALDENLKSDEKNIGAIYNMIACNDYIEINRMFDRLPIGHPAKALWDTFEPRGETVRQIILREIREKLRLLVTYPAENMITSMEIDLEAPAREKCVYYIFSSCNTSAFNPATAFISCLFAKLEKVYNGKSNTPVNFILDEFVRFGEIANILHYLSNPNIRTVIVCQSISQIENLYPLEWKMILYKCNTRLHFKNSDMEIIKYSSMETGLFAQEDILQQTVRDIIINDREKATLVKNVDISCYPEFKRFEKTDISDRFRYQ